MGYQRNFRATPGQASPRQGPSPFSPRPFKAPQASRARLGSLASQSAHAGLIQRRVEAFPLPPWVKLLPSFIETKARYKGVDAQAALKWASEELISIRKIVDVKKEEDLGDQLETLKDTLVGLWAKVATSDPDEAEIIGEKFGALAEGLNQVNLRLFRLKARETRYTEGERGKYGYHMTKVHNLPSIQVTGLDPGMGASNRGSLAMSTEEQKKGSEKTSRGMIAFGATPETFRPYINQAEDRRQMIPSVPLALKPVMLRFVIDDAIGLDNVLEGLDFMDARALNTQEKIPAGKIEVLTEAGWRALSAWDREERIAPLRDSEDDARTGKKWDGEVVILDWDDIQNERIAGFEILEKLHARSPEKAVLWMESQRDEEMQGKSCKFKFRGATMQTSGNPKTWEYAFTVPGKDLDKKEHLMQAHVRYMKSYLKIAQQHLEGYQE